MPVEVGQIVEGRITGITRFGAFMEISQGVTGLIHISEVADSFVKDVNDFLKENEVVKAKVISISEDGKISLSLRKANETSKPKQVDLSFEDKLAKFLKDSEERLLDIKRNHESKRGSGTYRKRKVL
ncbi:MAG TPA: S1 RNA-binding domain-containing protein [Thermoanaerobacterales bacterium]|uniref:S1 RNA-binding domain-containing protein n=1 Tax=Tepidanaerobacter sp. GT38 TaxID=2722793 RepID=UPI0017F959A8|nr:S1 RNA-binding domain-containing protein [Tepidanaerobacter sp. GT38]MCG1012035.1 S1 RNA-binding domain-containing protein [Tepidanaerobacter sp. GT38]HHY41596.1 S1 RNA-binding domain-containing protein [Thermoanaerobacterales bacterium]